MNNVWTLGAALTLAPSAALAAGPCPIPQNPSALLGSFSGLNVVTIEGFHGTNSDIQGKVLVLGHARFENYGIGSRLSPPSQSLTVNGTLTAANAQVYGGDAFVGGTCTTASFGIPSGELLCNYAGLDPKAGFEEEALAISDYLYTEPANGTVSVHPWGQVDLHGTADRNVFTLDLDAVRAQLAPWVWNGWINGFTIDAPAGSTVIVNVIGDTRIFLRNGAFNLRGGVDASGVLLNFYDASELTISNVGIKGSILAAKAKVKFDNGHIDGQMIADSIKGTGEFHSFSFGGELCR